MIPSKAAPPRFTYGDYRRWSDDERWELIDGEAFAMSPAPSRHHQEVLGGLHVQIAQFLRGSACRIYLAPFDVRLPRADERDDDVDTVVQPDLALVCDPAKLDAAGCRGAPDWIVEILSPNTSRRDLVQKRNLYARHGVREYWIVDPMHRTVLMHLLDPVHWVYAPSEPIYAEGSTPVQTQPGLAIDWSDGIWHEPSPAIANQARLSGP
jgi:Uma2 family endonuclease